MPGKLVNNSLSGLAQGVTQQYQAGRFDSQVDTMVNCMPSLTRGVLRRNPVQSVSTLVSLPDINTAFVYSYDRGTGTEQYITVIPGDGSIHTYNANNGAKITAEYNFSYLDIRGKGVTARDSFEAITLGDHTFIINKTIEIGFSTRVAPSIGYSNMAFYWIKKTASVIVSQAQEEDATDPNTIISGSKTLGYTYSLNGTTVTGITDSRPGEVDPNLGSAYNIAEEFKRKSSSVTKRLEAFGYNDTFGGSDWAWSDTFGDNASFGAWKSIDDSSKLPAKLPKDLDGFIVRVSGGTSVNYDDYFLKYNYDSKSWKEVAAPGTSIELNSNTMPHVLYRLTDRFKFSTYQGVTSNGTSLDGVSKWNLRSSGGEDPLQDPSFIGHSLNNIFFFKNRLGLMTSDSIVLSGTGDYGNFFPQTIQEVLDDDPIDLAVANTDVTILRTAVPTSGQLLLFSDDTQFVLESIDGPLTPISADISALSNYTYGKKAPAQGIGNRVYFTNQAGGYSQLYTYRVGGTGTRVSEATPMTIHLPTYIDSSVNRILGHDVLGYIFMTTEKYKKELIVLTTLSRGDEQLQNAFHKWTFKHDIVSVHIINTFLYILFSNKELVKMSLEVPGSITEVSYVDDFLSSNEYYDSYIKFSEFFLRDKTGKGTERGRYQLRTMLYDVTKDSKYTTIISNFNQPLIDTGDSFGPYWFDSDLWDDTDFWMDVTPYYTREYESDKKITVMSESSKADIVFRSSKLEPNKGFELSTLNIEALFNQRSTRT